jgi:hypothetical protein
MFFQQKIKLSKTADTYSSFQFTITQHNGRAGNSTFQRERGSNNWSPPAYASKTFNCIDLKQNIIRQGRQANDVEMKTYRNEFLIQPKTGRTLQM